MQVAFQPGLLYSEVGFHATRPGLERGMTVKEYVTRTLDTLSEDDLRHVAEYLAFLRFRARGLAVPLQDTERLAGLYKQFADEDRRIAEEGIADYNAALQSEDRA